MRRMYGLALAVAAVAVAPRLALAQEQTRTVSGGGISVPGWMGQVDPGRAKRGATIEQAKLEKQGDALHIVTGPEATYWNPANKASGDYTVKAHFHEPHFMNLSPHPHPYGLFIGGNDMGTPDATYLYCAAYGDGKFIVRGFGPAPFQLNGPEGESNPAVHKAAAKGEEVAQDIAMSVKGDRVTCSINGKEVASYPKSQVVGPGKLKSLDGVYGIRFAHNTEGHVTGLTMTKP